MFLTLLFVMGNIMNVATAIMVPVVFLATLDQITVGGTSYSLITLGVVAAIFYGMFNQLTGPIDIREPSLYRADHETSKLAFGSITITAALVALAWFLEYGPVVETLKHPIALPLLVGLVVFSSYDMFFLQRRKGRVIGQAIANQRINDPVGVGLVAAPPLAPPADAAVQVAAPPPAPPPSRRNVQTAWGIAIVLLLLIVVAALYAAGGPKGIKLSLGDLRFTNIAMLMQSDAVPGEIRYTGKTCKRRNGDSGREGYRGHELGCWQH